MELSFSWSDVVPFFGLGLVLGLGWRAFLRSLGLVLRAPSIVVGGD